MPCTAKWMHRCAIVRSVNHKAGCHNTLPGFTGSGQPVDSNDPIPKDSFPPGMGAVCEYLKPHGIDLPHYVALPTSLGWGFAIKRPGPWGGFLGKRFDPLCSECKPVMDPKPAPGRRLIEAGVRFVDVYWDGSQSRVPTSVDRYWDTHSNNFGQLKQVNLPFLDQTFDGLLGDLEDRGLLDETLVVMMSDFGRTPRVNGSVGRDHWTFCYSVVLAGAGIKGGTVCGASDAQAASVKNRPVRPADICVTIYQSLGIDPDILAQDEGGRPVPIADGGGPIRKILA